MSLSLSPEQASAAHRWLQGVSRKVLSRGKELARFRAVIELEWDDHARKPGIVATVQGGEQYQLTLPFTKGEFGTSTCTCPYAVDCKHAVAAVTVALQAPRLLPLRLGATLNSEQPPNLMGKQSNPSSARGTDGLLKYISERSKKPLSAIATDRLRTIDEWWQARKHHVNLGQFLRLLGLRDFVAGDSAHLYASADPPRDALEYLACVDAEVTRRGGQLPAPLPDFIDRARQEEMLTALHRDKQVKEWQHRIQGWARNLEWARPQLPTFLRLRLSHEGGHLEFRHSEHADFGKLTVGTLKELHPDAVPSAEEVLIRLSRTSWGDTRVQFPRDDEALRQMVVNLLAFPQYRHAIAGVSGNPLNVHDTRLHWQLTREDSDDYVIQLVNDSGEVPPKALFIMRGRPTWYVSAEEAWPVRTWPFDNYGREVTMRIPASVLETVEGLTVLRSAGLPLPEALESKIRRISPKVTVQARVGDGGMGIGASLQLRAKAEYDQFAPLEWWRGGAWAPEKQSAVPPSKGEIWLFEKDSLKTCSAWLSSLNLRQGPYRDPTQTWWDRRITKDFPDQFLQWMAARPEDVVVELDGELASLREGVVSASVRLDVEETGMDWFDLRVALGVADTTLTPEEIQLLLKAQGRWVRITGKGWRKLHFEMTPEQEAELAAMGLTVADFDGAPQRLHALQLAGGAGKEKSLLPAERVEAVRRRAEEIRTRVQPGIPATITAQLRPYQLEGFHFLAYLSANRFGGVLADDMGLGKTLQSLTWLAWLRETEQARDAASSEYPVLVVCPKSVQDNWRSETARFCPDLRVVVWSRDDAGKSGLSGEADLVVIHYQQLRQHEEALSRQRWLAVILDEAQAIKNPSSLSAKAACALQAGHRLALSGTPVENRLLDLWSILGFAMPGILGNRTHFAKHFDAKEDPLARRRLAARVRPFLLRRTKKEVAKDLPDRVEEDLVCELEGSQRTLYQAELKRARAALLNIKTTKQLDKARFNILTSLLRLRQICCHPALVLQDSDSDAGAKSSIGKTAKRPRKASSADAATAATGSAKLDALLELLEPIMEEGGKVLVFSQFVEMLSLVRSQLETREWPHFLLTGQTEDRGVLVQQFQECIGPAVFLISLKAGGFGLNLTAASYVVLCDPWWNPAVEAQAIDRTHRIGQTQKVNAYRLIVKDSIEEKIRLLQKQKSALANDILGEENFAAALSLDDFRFLLGEE